MVETITPVVHGGRRFRYLRSVAIHTLAATVAAGTVGLLLGALGALAGGPWSPGGLIVLGALAAVYAARELFRLPIPLPDRKAQVPAWWRGFYGPDVTAALYGLGLGPGFLTYLTFGTYAAVLAGSFITADPLLGALISAPFGFARGLSILVGMRAKQRRDVCRHRRPTHQVRGSPSTAPDQRGRAADDRRSGLHRHLNANRPPGWSGGLFLSLARSVTGRP